MTERLPGIDQAAPTQPMKPSVLKRVRSKIKFPYTDQDEARRVVTLIHNNAGEDVCSRATRGMVWSTTDQWDI